MRVLEWKNRIFDFRKNAFSQSELDKKAGVARNTTYRLENGITKCPHPKTRQKIADALNQDVTEIFIPIEV